MGFNPLRIGSDGNTDFSRMTNTEFKVSIPLESGQMVISTRRVRQ